MNDTVGPTTQLTFEPEISVADPEPPPAPPVVEKSHLVVVPPSEPEPVLAPAPILPAPKRLIRDDPNDPALNYLDSITRNLRVDDSSHNSASGFRRLIGAFFDLIFCALLTSLIGLAIYLTGRRRLPADPPLRPKAKADRPAMTSKEWGKVILLVAMLPVLSASIVGNNQIFNAYLVWAEKSADLRLFGIPILTTWMVSVDSIVSVACLLGMVMFWRAWATRFPEPDELGKITIGCLFAAAGVACLGIGSILAQATGAKVGFGWLLAFHLLNDIGFANVLPVGLALFARSAPKAIAGTVVGIYYLHLFAGNLTVGWLGGLLEKMPAAQFWLMHAAIVGGAGVVFFFVRMLFGHMLLGVPAEPDIVAADAGETP